jgi:hypothetical protein
LKAAAVSQLIVAGWFNRTPLIAVTRTGLSTPQP